MAAQAPILTGPPTNLEIKGRRRLNDDAAFEALVDELKELLEKYKESPVKVVITDCDLSQNKWTKNSFEALILVLASFNVRVQRFRLFGCPGLNDEVMNVLAEYVRMIDSSTTFEELHLSDCAITSDGFLAFMEAIEDSSVFPYTQRSGTLMPLYLRLENNYIDEEVIRDKINCGIVRGYRKTDGGPRRGPAAEGVKVDLILQSEGLFKQKKGIPPAPQDAPPPKQVWDKNAQSEMQQSWNAMAGGWQAPAPYANGGKACGKGPMGGVSYGAGYGPAANAAASFRPSPYAAAPSYSTGKGGWQQSPSQTPGAAWPSTRGNAAPNASSFTTRTPQSNAYGARQTAANAAGRANAAAAASSRPTTASPAMRAQAPAAKPMPKPSLPHPWEEHFSDEYKIPYYWNPDTGDSLWERPT